jgi:hypothetical protein
MSGVPLSGSGGVSGSAGGNLPPIACNVPFAGTQGACTTYAPTSIVTMRKAPASGCFELAHVGLITISDSPSEPRIYLQDANGTDFSAIQAKCAMTASHACPAAVRDRIPTLSSTSTGGAQLSVRGFYQYGMVSGFEEFYIEDILDECKNLARPAPISLSLSDITRVARVPAKWFQRANVVIPPDNPLVTYDFAPADLKLAQTQCPDFAGFAMVPKSAGAAAAVGCAGTTSPAARTTDPMEVLIGRQFFAQFSYSTDCACTAGTTQKLLTPTSSVSGTVLGYLILEQDKGSTSPYQVFEPTSNKTFPIH